jgi:hypothetical protein
MPSFNSAQLGDHGTRAELWSSQLKEILTDHLDAMRWVDWMTDFPDGTQFNIPSIGQASVQDIVENKEIEFEAMDTGEFNFVINEYTGSAHYITKKALQDSYIAGQVMASFVPKQSRAILEKLESDILKMVGPNAKSGGGQTAADLNNINGHAHRFVGSGSSSTVAVADFARAKLSLKKANVPMSSLIAIVDPQVAHDLETTSTITDISNNAQWQGIVETGLTSGMRFIRNIYGFDVYESNYVERIGAETIDGVSTGATGVQNIMFCADPSATPFKGAWRQNLEVDSQFNMGKQREEYLTTARYGLKLFRQESVVSVLSNT